MTEYQCFCGKTVSSARHLGQHVAQTDDRQHNFVEDRAEPTGNNPENLIEEWEENASQEEQEELTINEVETPDNPADHDPEPEDDGFEKIAELEAEKFTKAQIKKLKKAQKNGYTEYNPETEELRK